MSPESCYRLALLKISSGTGLLKCCKNPPSPAIARNSSLSPRPYSYIDGCFEPREQVYGTVINVWGPRVLHLWRLAIMPHGNELHMHDLYNDIDFNEEALVNAGWIL